MKQLFKNLINKKGLQPFFKNLSLLSLAGMNYSNRDFEKNGELHTLGYIKSRLQGEKHLTIFDVGGNIGTYSEAVSKYFGSNATVHGFEPSLRTFEIFQETTQGYNNIIANNFGMGSEVASLTLYSDKEASGLASVYQRNISHFGIQMANSETIDISTIDIYCSNNNIDRIHFLKLDIEGHELSALKGAEKLLSQGKIDFIQFEFGGANIDSRTFFQDFFFLLQKNYKIYRIVGNGLIELPKYQESLEIFITINYLAELR